MITLRALGSVNRELYMNPSSSGNMQERERQKVEILSKCMDSAGRR